MKALLPPLMVALALAGCQPAPPPATQQGEATASAAPVPAAGSGDAEVDDAVDDAVPGDRQTAEFPTLDLATVDGGRYVLAERRGSWVVVNFWATWCAPCLKEMPELSALHDPAGKIEVVGLAYEEIEPADLQAFLAKRPVSYPIAIADPFDPPADFAVPRGLPMTWLIAPDGKVAHQFLGPVTAHDIVAEITALGGQVKAPAH